MYQTTAEPPRRASFEGIAALRNELASYLEIVHESHARVHCEQALSDGLYPLLWYGQRFV